MSIFASTLNQIVFLFSFIVIGYVLMKTNVLPKNSSVVLSKLENVLFIPALVMGTFIENFTVDRMISARNLLIVSLLLAIIVIPFAIVVSKIVTKDAYTQRIYIYGLSFSNFGFMGNAVVSSLFPDIFFEYLIFTLPLWTLIYLWGVPRLLIANTTKKESPKELIKSFINPMFISMLIGMLVGLFKIRLPQWIVSLISVSGGCMSPIAMLLTGIVVSSISLKTTFTNIKIYIISFVRLIVIPLIFILIVSKFNIPKTIYVCAICSLSMPLGLNTIVIPSALGKDTSIAAGMTIISHLFSCVTIPFIFWIIE